MWTLDILENYLKEYGWTYKIIENSNAPSVKSVLTSYKSAVFENNIVITLKIQSPFLWITTNKLFKFDDPSVTGRFLEWNDKTPAGKWLAYNQSNETYVNYACEIHDQFATREFFFFQMDLLTYNVDNMLRKLQQENLLSDSVLANPSVVTKDSLNFSP